MGIPIRPQPTILVIFGGGGDLTHRKLVPALFNLYLDQWLPERFAVIGIDRVAMSDDAFRQHMRQGVDEFSRSGKTTDEAWQPFAAGLGYFTGDFANDKTYAELAGRLAAQDTAWNTASNHLFYLATPPTLVEGIAGRLANAQLTADRPHSRVVFEKPFGHDL
jgi:glucose-6-phosphate 1-dehydrogenase